MVATEVEPATQVAESLVADPDVLEEEATVMAVEAAGATRVVASQAVDEVKAGRLAMEAGLSVAAAEGNREMDWLEVDCWEAVSAVVEKGAAEKVVGWVVVGWAEVATEMASLVEVAATGEHLLVVQEEMWEAGVKVVEETVAGVMAVVATAAVLMAVLMAAGMARSNRHLRCYSRLSTRGSRLNSARRGTVAVRRCSPARRRGLVPEPRSLRHCNQQRRLGR